MRKLKADDVARAFNDNAPSNWRARPYMKVRSATGVFNAVNFTYKRGMVSFQLDCDAPFGRGFQVKFHQFVGAFGDYLSAIQKGLYHICSRLRDAGMVDNISGDLTPAHIMFGMRKDGAIVYLHMVDAAPLADWEDYSPREYERTDEGDQRPECEKIDIDDLL